ncbi:hypothetical protein FFI89_018700 [Bradyrhizobium sp. KBS0727]|uniref:hypothetical protein n=1 Tax=unclassified Bradyrhizobium TaxID=2631580 RepID=UPI00110EF54A|nr:MULTISPECIES: hypothetical protein [unclassified Bradyrhizobium]QDW38995.1 hypothetical protein FFI71_018700 [Bradyrhizobium sp. KBS0725]QDW45598.1 hypothetical protein FFI89_018700 [Bradyrhizobium sp. KBS0727]
MKLLERIYDGLTSNTLQTVGALIIFLLALPLIRAGLREKPQAPPPPQPSPIEVESPWFVQNFLQMQTDVERMKDQLGGISSQLAGVVKLLRRRHDRATKPKK